MKVPVSIDGVSGAIRYQRTCAICGEWVRYVDHIMYLATGKKRRIRVHLQCLPDGACTDCGRAEGHDYYCLVAVRERLA